MIHVDVELCTEVTRELHVPSVPPMIKCIYIYLKKEESFFLLLYFIIIMIW